MTEQMTEGMAFSLPIEDVQDTLACNLSAARGALGLSQDQLAILAGVSRATINQLEGGSAGKSDPRLSTLVSIAAALGISPVILLLGRAELGAIAEAPKSKEVGDIRSHLTGDELQTMQRLLRSGVAKNRTKAVKIGTAAAAAIGMSTSAIAAAAIGTTILPGIGTAIGAVIGSIWVANRIKENKNSE